MRSVRDSSTPEAWVAEGGVGETEGVVNTEKGEPVGERAVRDPQARASWVAGRVEGEKLDGEGLDEEELEDELRADGGHSGGDDSRG